MEFFKPDCGLTVFRDPEVASQDGEPDDDCLFDEYATQNFQRAWLPREEVSDIPAAKIRSMALRPLAWDGISTERFLILSHAEREIMGQAGPRIDLDDYQGSGRLELAGGAGRAKTPWATWQRLWPRLQGRRQARLDPREAKIVKEHIVLLFHPDVEP